MADVVHMPALSDTMEEGTLVAWHKNVGDTVKAGDLLAEIETDKAVMEFQSFYDGVLLYIGVEEGHAVPVDAIIAVIGKEGEDFKALISADSSKKTLEVAPIEEPSKEVIETITAPLVTESTTTDNSRVKASPLAKSIAKEEGIDINNIKGTGEDGRITKRDVEDFINNKSLITSNVTASQVTIYAPPASSSPVAQGDFEDVAVNQMRKVIARRLGESKFTAPHFYLTMEINMDKLISTRKQVNELSESKISFNDFIVKATAKALKEHRVINASWLGDKIRYYNYVNIGVAVGMDEGLVVPVIKNTDTKSLSQIANEIKDMASKAKDRKLTSEEMTGNTFTISNLGMFGIDEFTAIINPPDACILAVGGINSRLVLVNGEVKESNFMKLTLSCDHRVVDGVSGAKFLQTLKAILEEPMRLII